MEADLTEHTGSMDVPSWPSNSGGRAVAAAVAAAKRPKTPRLARLHHRTTIVPPVRQQAQPACRSEQQEALTCGRRSTARQALPAASVACTWSVVQAAAGDRGPQARCHCDRETHIACNAQKGAKKRRAAVEARAQHRKPAMPAAMPPVGAALPAWH